MAVSYPIRTPRWSLQYIGKNITADVSGMMVEIAYEEKINGASSDLEIHLEDRDRRWQGPWYPVQGDTVHLHIGYEGERGLDCGDFQVEELELTGPPDTFRMKCLSTGISTAARTRTSAGFEGQTLGQIATTIAAKNGWTITNVPTAINVIYARVTQNHKTDLQFLTRLANEQNYDFSVKGTELIFVARAHLESLSDLLTIERTMVTAFEFKAKGVGTYQTTEVNYQDPATKSLITARASSAQAIPTGDMLRIATRAETPTDAMLKAQSALHDANMTFTTGKLTLEGTPKLRAGGNVQVLGFGQYDGKYQITSAHHRLERDSGYTTEIEIRQGDDPGDPGNQ
jgi:phage protein D